MSPLLIAVLIGVIVFTAYLAIDAYFGRQHKLSQLQSIRNIPEDYYTPDGQESLVELTDKLSPGAQSVEMLLKATGINVDSARRELRSKLQHAGINSPDAPVYLLFYRRILGYIIAMVGLLVISIRMDGELQYAAWIGGGLLLVCGLYGAQLFIKNTTQKRQQSLLKAFPDTLDLMVVCVESGLALDAALSRVTRELGRAYPEINEELNRTRLELSLLNDRSRALLNLGERTNLVAFRSLVAALIQTERFGTSLTETIRVLSDDYRHTRLMVAENKAGRLPALMTIPLITLLLPALFVIILAPAFISVAAQGGIFGGG